MAQMDVIGAKLSFPPLPALNDVVTREVTIEGAGVVENGVFTPQTITQGYPKDASLTDEIFGPEGQAIRATLVDIDNAGNRSPVGDVLEATLADTFAPAKPGSLGIVFTGEVTVEVPEPTTEAPSEEPTTEAPSEEPTTEAPSEEPTTEAPSEEPTTEAPSEEPTTEAPSEEPSTEAPSEEPPVV